MRSIKYKILISFCILAIVSIVVLAVVISGKINDSISQQSEELAANMTTQMYETLNLPHQTFELLIQEDIRRSTEDLRKSPTLVNNLESGQLKVLQAELHTAAANLGLDFAIVLNLNGQVEASFPSTLHDLKIEEYLKTWEFGAHTLSVLKGETPDTDTLWDTLSRHDSEVLKDFGLSDRDILGKGALSIVAAGIVKNDFGESLGICLIGQLLNNYEKPLQHLHNIAGYASVIYLDTTPVAQAGFENPEGEVLDLSALQISPEIQAAVYNTNEKIDQVLTLAGKPYLTTCSNMKSFTGKNIGILCVGLPESQITEVQQAIFARSSKTKTSIERWIVAIGVIVLSFFALASLGLATMIVNPIKQLSNVARISATGDFRQEITVDSRDEVGLLANSFRELVAYILDVTEVADRISYGDLHVGVIPRSEEDTLNKSLERMITYIQDVESVAERISNDDLQVEVTPKSEQDTLNVSLQRMVTNLQVAREKIERSIAEIEQQNWLKTGQAELSNVMRGEQDLPTLATNIITYLANYVQAQVGAVYLVDKENMLRLVGSYAYATKKGNRNAFALGEGLVGQAALEKRSILFTNVPDDYIVITSGLGETVPRYIIIIPFLYEGEMKGIIELGTVAEFPELQRTFLDQALENIAIAFHSAQVREKMQELLEETQQQAEELQAQQEQLRVNNEELEAQTDALRKSEQRLQTQQEELRQTNEALEEQTRTLEEQQKILQEKNLELEKARRLVEEKAKELELTSKYKSEFLANMSHELRTPLNSLLILSKLLTENKDENLTEKQIEFAQTIYAAGSELLALINEVLDLSKVEAGRMELKIEEMSLKGFSHYIEQHFAHMAEEKGLDLKTNLADGLPPVIHTDRQRVEQIVKNLLSNAMKFTAKGGWVTFDIARPASHVDFSSSRSGLTSQHAIAFSVSDTGIGIPEDKQHLIFEAFQQANGTTSRKYGGTGLGLSITRELVKLLGGEMHVHSEEGKGSTFTFYLPEVLTAPQQIERSANPYPDEIPATEETLAVERPPLLTERRSEGVEAIRDDRHEEIFPSDKFLLIIEDDPNFAKILFDLARENGFKGLIAGDGAAGLQLAYQYIPSAIILDIALPGMDGWMVMEKLKQNPETRHIPVHFISAADQPLEAWKMGAIGYLTKPVTMDQIHEAFQTIEEEISKTIKKLLIVEDDEDTRFSMCELLKGDDVDITTAQTGEEAYTLLESKKFDCMVLDLGLEDISGMDLLEKIHEEARISHLPIIIYTGKELTKEEDLQLEKYAESIIIKGVKSHERLLDEVTLFLHRVEADLPEAQQKKLRMIHDKEAVLSGKTVLMVDDDMRNVFALSNVLEEKGMQVLVAEHGKEALELLEQHPEIDIVLMDIMMPEMDGYEAMGHIRKQPTFKTLPIIALTAKAMKGDRQRCIDAGASDYLSKPVDTNKLLSLLRVWLY